MPNQITWHNAALTTANTAKDGTGTVAALGPFTSDVYVDRLVLRAAGTNTASVARVFINNGQPNVAAANNVLFNEGSLPATTLSEVAALAGVTIDMGVWLPKGYRLLVTIGTTVAAGYYLSAVLGEFYANQDID